MLNVKHRLKIASVVHQSLVICTCMLVETKKFKSSVNKKLKVLWHVLQRLTYSSVWFWSPFEKIETFDTPEGYDKIQTQEKIHMSSKHVSGHNVA